MAAVIDPAVVEYEYDRKQPYYCCIECDVKDTKRGMEDHLVKRHASVPAPFECRECHKRFFRRDAARGHTTKQHTKKIFKEIIKETKVKSSWLTDHAILLTREEGLLAVQEKLLTREQPRAREAANHASGVTAQNKAPASLMPSSPSASASTASQPPAAASAIVTADSPARISVPATPDLVLHPLTDDFQLTPDVPAVDPVDSLPDPAPAMPTLLDIMRGLNELTTKQETVISAVHGLEAQQEKIQECITKLETEVAKHGRYCSAAQGENRKLKDSLTELKDDARQAASEGGRAATESRRATDGIQEVKRELAKVRETTEKVLADGVNDLKVKMAKLRLTAEKTLSEVEVVKDDMKDTQDDVRKVADNEEKILESLRPVAMIRDTTKRIADSIPTVSTSQTRTVARSQAAFREMLHGVSRTLDAFENRPNAHQVPRNDSGRTEREERARRPLDL